MFKWARKSFLLALGSAVLTGEKVRGMLNRLVEQGRMTQEEAEKLNSELMESGQKQWEEIRSNIRDSVRKGLEGLDIGSNKEFKELKNRVENLEARLVLLESIVSKTKDERKESTPPL